MPCDVDDVTEIIHFSHFNFEDKSEQIVRGRRKLRWKKI